MKVDKKKFVRGSTAAHLLDISLRQLYNLRDAGKIPYVKLSPRVVLYSMEQIEKTLEAYTIRAVGGAK